MVKAWSVYAGLYIPQWMGFFLTEESANKAIEGAPVSKKIEVLLTEAEAAFWKARNERINE